MSEKSALPRTIIIKFSLTRNKALAVMIVALLCIMSADLGCETLTLTTYYPAPYGVYSKMRVTQYSQSGPAGQVIRTGDLTEAPACPGIPAGGRGIYAEGINRDIFMGASRNAVISPRRSIMLNPQGIGMAGGVKEIEFGTDVYIKDFCRWVAYSDIPLATYCNGSRANSIGWSVFMSANASNQSSTKFVKDVGWDDTVPATQITHAAFVMSPAGNMLCCRGRTQ